jgi:calcium-dependent protein kinase
MGSICAGQGVISIVDPTKSRSSLAYKLEVEPTHLDPQNLFYSRYDLHPNPIGYGEHGEVWICSKKNTNKIKAVKIINKSCLSGLVLEGKAFLRYVYGLKRIKSSLIVKIYNVCEERDAYFVVNEQLKHGDLYDLIEFHVKIPENQAAEVVLQVLAAVSRLQDSYYKFNNIKPENILFSDRLNMVLKVNSLNISGILKELPSDTSFLSPEVRSGKFNDKCDCWSIGLIMYYLLSGILPDKKNVCFSPPAAFLSEISENAKDLLMKLLDPDPATRISIKEAVNHDWIKSNCELNEIEITN